MSHPVSVFNMRESVGRVMEVLKNETHNGFPVVEDYTPNLLHVGPSVFMNKGLQPRLASYPHILIDNWNMVFELHVMYKYPGQGTSSYLNH